MHDDIELLHADEDWLVLVKPAGLLSVPGLGEAGKDNLAARVQAHFADALIVHRLDMATSGLILFARGPEAQRRLSRAFEMREVSKSYVAVVEGLLLAESGVIDEPLAADWPQRPRQRVDRESGKPARTAWRVLSRDAAQGCTRLALEPLTGRSHQLRVHLLSLGHPIRGDALYASEPLRAPRLLLHASQLQLAHPRLGHACRFESPAPF